MSYVPCWNEFVRIRCQQHSNNLSAVMSGFGFGVICYIHELQNQKSGREFQEYISAHCLLYSNQLFDCFLHKSNMVNDVPE
jgi:hypothetical protein